MLEDKTFIIAFIACLFIAGGVWLSIILKERKRKKFDVEPPF